MKFLTVFLSLYIFLLSVQPALALIDFSHKTECCKGCCGGDCEKPLKEKKENNNSCDGVCNPLLSCGGCTGFTFSFESFSFSPCVINSEQKSIYTLIAVSEITIPIWQPPKIC